MPDLQKPGILIYILFNYKIYPIATGYKERRPRPADPGPASAAELSILRNGDRIRSSFS